MPLLISCAAAGQAGGPLSGRVSKNAAGFLHRFHRKWDTLRCFMQMRHKQYGSFGISKKEGRVLE